MKKPTLCYMKRSIVAYTSVDTEFDEVVLSPGDVVILLENRCWNKRWTRNEYQVLYSGQKLWLSDFDNMFEEVDL